MWMFKIECASLHRGAHVASAVQPSRDTVEIKYRINFVVVVGDIGNEGEPPNVCFCFVRDPGKRAIAKLIPFQKPRHFDSEAFASESWRISTNATVPVVAGTI
jgi:hypothetical protein